MQQLNRLQNRNDFLLADRKSGDVRRVFRDESKAWVDVVDEVQWIDDGKAFLWLSERDGWQHVFRVPRDGGDATLVTRFDADATDVVGLDDKGGWLYFLASPERATDRYLYRSRLDGTRHARARDAAGSAGHAQLRHRARRPSGVPHLLALRRAADDRRRRSAGAPIAAQADRHVGARRRRWRRC